MGRVFTTSFEHDGQPYTAVVSLSTTRDQDLTLHIQIPDESLHHLLPGGRVTLGAKSLQDLLEGQPELSQKLIRCIIQTVARRVDPDIGHQLESGVINL
jgi:hypothetical protein